MINLKWSVYLQSLMMRWKNSSFTVKKMSQMRDHSKLWTCNTFQIRRIQHTSSVQYLISSGTTLLKYQRPERDSHLVMNSLHSLMWSVCSQVGTNCLPVFRQVTAKTREIRQIQFASGNSLKRISLLSKLYAAVNTAIL